MGDFIVVGVDPSANRHGVAYYQDAKLIRLAMLTTVQLVTELVDLRDSGTQVLVGVENVSANNFVYGRNSQVSKAKHARIARNVGQCQKAHKGLIEWLDHHQIEYRQYPPCESNWAKHRSAFERITGWTENSNKDTRSAAYFGFLTLRYV